MTKDNDASADADRATAAEPVVSALRDGIPSAISTAEMQIGPVTLTVHQLDNGQRVIEEQSLIRFFEALEAGTLALSAFEANQIAEMMRD